MPNKRLQYIDCLRGAAMLMVVYSHVLSFMMGRLQPSPLGLYMRDIMLPLFFFISGFCAYKSNREWSLRSFGQQVWRKTRAILIPTIIMFLLMMLYSGQNVMDVIFRYDKSGYWFTWVLFQILIVYTVFDVVSRSFSNRWCRLAVTLLPLVLFAVIFHFVGYGSRAAYLFEWVKVVGFYYFFLAGVLVRWYQPQVQKVLANRYFSSGLFITALVVYNQFGGGKTMLLNVLLIYFVFQSVEPWFSKQGNRLTYVLSTIGRHTLEIYFIHFFLLFTIPVVPEWLNSLSTDACFGNRGCNSLPEFVIVGAISVLLCYVCLAIKKVVGLFPLVYELCFGPQKT